MPSALLGRFQHSPSGATCGHTVGSVCGRCQAHGGGSLPAPAATVKSTPLPLRGRSQPRCHALGALCTPQGHGHRHPGRGFRGPPAEDTGGQSVSLHEAGETHSLRVSKGNIPGGQSSQGDLAGETRPRPWMKNGAPKVYAASTPAPRAWPPWKQRPCLAAAVSRGAVTREWGPKRNPTVFL